MYAGQARYIYARGSGSFSPASRSLTKSYATSGRVDRLWDCPDPAWHLICARYRRHRIPEYWFDVRALHAKQSLQEVVKDDGRAATCVQSRVRVYATGEAENATLLSKCMLESLVNVRLNARLHLLLLRAIARSNPQRLLEVRTNGLEEEARMSQTVLGS